MTERLHAATRAIRAGLPRAAQGEAFLPGPTFAGPYHAVGDPKDSAFSYARMNNPTWTHFENALGELEGGHAIVFPSGMAAIAAIFETTLIPGDAVVLPSDCYYTTRIYANEQLRPRGIEIRMAPTAGDAQSALTSGAKLIWLETPSNPGLDVCDIARFVRAARDAKALVAVDNTTATPLGQLPLELGCDFSVSSDTKALSGHGDLVLGHVAVRDAAVAERIRAWRTHGGAIPGPMEVWLAHRSLATLEMRVTRQCANALAIATFLQSQPLVSSVRYPGLPNDPAHETAKRQMSSYGCVLSFELPDRATAERFLAACELVSEATSFGSVHTSAERRARWAADAVPEGFIRFSAGCEDVSDLTNDIARALAGAR